MGNGGRGDVAIVYAEVLGEGRHRRCCAYISSMCGSRVEQRAGSVGKKVERLYVTEKCQRPSETKSKAEYETY